VAKVKILKNRVMKTDIVSLTAMLSKVTYNDRVLGEEADKQA
jgi:hypothetical protein